MSSYENYGNTNKPDSNCRTCNDFKFWSKQQRQIFHKAGDVSFCVFQAKNNKNNLLYPYSPRSQLKEMVTVDTLKIVII